MGPEMGVCDHAKQYRTICSVRRYDSLMISYDSLLFALEVVASKFLLELLNTPCRIDKG